MAANTDKFIKVGESTATTLSSPGYTAGATSINVASTTNWPTGTGVIFAIDEVDSGGVRISGTYNSFVGTVASGTQITNVSYLGGDANRNYSAGATTRVFIHLSADWVERLIDGILESHAQDGTIDAQSVANFQDHIDMVNGKAIRDGNNNELIKFSETASAVNEFTVANAATGNAPALSATGGDTNIDINLTPKGTGNITKVGNNIDWWEEIGRTTLGSAGDTITVDSLPARKYLKVIIHSEDTGGTTQHYVRFNNDSGSNYAYKHSANGAAAGAATSTTQLIPYPSTAADPKSSYLEIINILAQEKLVTAYGTAEGGAGAANAPDMVHLAGKWANTSAQISRIDVVNASGTGDFAAGSEVIVLGHN